jgi:hypothetical protein
MSELELPKPECESGYPQWQVEEILAKFGRSQDEFGKWVYGQTMSLCQGQSYNYNTRSYDEKCGGVAHGGIVYPWDLERFLQRKRIID